MVGDSEPIAVLLTHGHCDHVSALDEICEYYNIPAYLHPLDQELLQLIRRRPSVYKKKMYTNCENFSNRKITIRTLLKLLSIIHLAIVLAQFVLRLVDILFLEILYSNKM